MIFELTILHESRRDCTPGSSELRRSSTGLEDVYTGNCKKLTFQCNANGSGKSNSKEESYGTAVHRAKQLRPKVR